MKNDECQELGKQLAEASKRGDYFAAQFAAKNLIIMTTKAKLAEVTKQRDSLQFALADAEALDLGTAERLECAAQHSPA